MCQGWRSISHSFDAHFIATTPYPFIGSIFVCFAAHRFRTQITTSTNETSSLTMINGDSIDIWICTNSSTYCYYGYIPVFLSNITHRHGMCQPLPKRRNPGVLSGPRAIFAHTLCWANTKKYNTYLYVKGEIRAYTIRNTEQTVLH